MPRLDVAVPAGFLRFDEGPSLIVCRADIAPALLTAIRAAPFRNPTLHGYAAANAARSFEGRDIAHAITLPGTSINAVIRHNRHGGALRTITGDLFTVPTRAPAELAISLELQRRRVPCAEVIAYAIYPVGFGLARSDVISVEVRDSRDLGALLLATSPGSNERRDAWAAVSTLLVVLSGHGVRHRDLNVKNILLPRTGNAMLLDLDEVRFDAPDCDAANRARLVRSVEKWRDTRGARVSDGEIAALRSTGPSIL